MTTLEDRIRSARATVEAAEHKLDEALTDVDAVDRAQKMMITEALRVALDNVAAAKAALDLIDRVK
jgi:hypothetical protein